MKLVRSYDRLWQDKKLDQLRTRRNHDFVNRFLLSYSVTSVCLRGPQILESVSQMRSECAFEFVRKSAPSLDWENKRSNLTYFRWALSHCELGFSSVIDTNVVWHVVGWVLVGELYEVIRERSNWVSVKEVTSITSYLFSEQVALFWGGVRKFHGWRFKRSV